MAKKQKENFWKKLGPGFITGASDDDPSGIATYSQVGAQFGLGMLWTALLCWPLMVAAQEMVARIGMVAGQGVTAIIKKKFPRWLVSIFVLSLLVANTFNIGADLGAMAASARLLVPQIPFTIMTIGFTVLILMLEIFISYRTYVKILKWLGLCLLSYVLTLLIVTTNWVELLYYGIVPHFVFSKEFIISLTAVLGTTISPYLFVWQSNEEVEEEIALGRATVKLRHGATKKEIRAMRRDTMIGMAFSEIVTFCIIGTAANTFFQHGIFDIGSADQAAQALAPLAGRFASLVFSIGIIGVGLMAVPVLSASAAYALAESFDWSAGLYKKFRDAHGFYGVITISTLIGLIVNFIGIDPIKTLFLAAVLNGLITPIVLAFILKVANDEKVMGKHKNSRLSNIINIVTLVVTAICAILIFIP